MFVKRTAFSSCSAFRVPSGLHLLAILLVLTAAFPVCAGAQVVDMTEMVLDNQAGMLRVRFGLAVEEVEPLAEALRDGGEIELRCEATLSAKRTLLWNKSLAEAEIVSRVEFLSLPQEFRVFFPDTDTRLEGPELSALLNEAWENLSLNLGRWSELEQGNSYLVTMRITLTRVETPAWVRSVLFFWSWKAADPVDVVLEFTY